MSRRQTVLKLSVGGELSAYYIDTMKCSSTAPSPPVHAMFLVQYSVWLWWKRIFPVSSLCDRFQLSLHGTWWSSWM